MRFQLTNTRIEYGWLSIILHWLSFLLVCFLLISGVVMMGLHYLSPMYQTLTSWHDLLGVFLGLVTLLRMAWILCWPKPRILANAPWQRWAAIVVHGLLYGLLLALFVTGYLVLTGDGAALQLMGVDVLPSLIRLNPQYSLWVGSSHRWFAYSLAALVSLHVLAACFHHWVKGDDTLRRMIYPKSSQ